jgi:hypothetical protein
LHRREAPENRTLIKVFARSSQRLEFGGAETVAAAPPQQIETFRAELFK